MDHSNIANHVHTLQKIYFTFTLDRLKYFVDINNLFLFDSVQCKILRKLESLSHKVSSFQKLL